MKNYKTILILLTLPTYSFSQNISVSLDIGYGFELHPNSIPDGDIRTLEQTATISTKEFKTIRHSYGEGTNLGGLIEYSLNEKIEAGLGFSYLIAKTEDRNIFDLDGLEKIDLISSKLSRIIPQLKFNIPLWDNYIYTRFGFIIGIKPKIIEERDSHDPKNMRRIEKFGGSSYGFLAGVGYSFKLGEKFVISPEFRIFSQTYGPRQSETTTSMSQGQDITSSLLPWERYSRYENSYQKNYYPNGIDTSKPSIQNRRFESFSSVGANITFAYVFSGK